MLGVFDCRTCGICCVSTYDQDVFCDVTPQDIKRMGRKARNHVLGLNPFDFLLAQLSGYGLPSYAIRTRRRCMKQGPFKGVEACVCWFLRGSLFHRVSCRIYDHRPRVCRTAVKPGSQTCKEARRLFKDARQ